jgi:hypothetical protein
MIFPATGEDENTESDGASPNKKGKRQPGRKAGQKSKNQEGEHETGNNQK